MGFLHDVGDFGGNAPDPPDRYHFHVTKMRRIPVTAVGTITTVSTSLGSHKPVPVLWEGLCVFLFTAHGDPGRKVQCSTGVQ